MIAKTFIAAAIGITTLLPLTSSASPFHHKTNSDAFGLQVAEDINPAPNVVEINLEAKVSYVELTPGIPSEVYTSPFKVALTLRIYWSDAAWKAVRP